MLTYVYYTHTDYEDVINISADRIVDYENKILMINSNSQNLDNLYSKFKNVVFYDDNLTWVGRCLEGIKKIKFDCDYALFINDTDLIIDKDDLFLEKLVSIAKEHKIDKLDLQYQHRRVTKNTSYIDLKNGEKTYSLIKQNQGSPYVYNVNPSIYNIKSYIRFLENFKDIGYRDIEKVSQEYVKENWNVYKCNGKYLNAGFMAVMPFFQYLHITRAGKFIPPVENNIQSPFMLKAWQDVIKKYNLPGKRGWCWTHRGERICNYQSRNAEEDNLYK